MLGEGKRRLDQERSLGVKEAKGPSGHLPSFYSPASRDWGSQAPCSPDLAAQSEVIQSPQGQGPPSRCPVVPADWKE